MSTKQWKRIRDGVIGTFQPLTVPALEPAPGMIKLTDEHAEVTFMATEDHRDDRLLPLDCRAVFGETEAGAVLMVSIAQRGGQIGATSTARYRARCVVLDPAPEHIDDDTAVAARLDYYGLAGWSGERRLRDKPIEEDGKVVGWTAELRWDPGTRVPLDTGFALRFSAGHSVSGPYDQRTLASPLVISVESDHRHSIGEHILRLDAVHALLALAHREKPLAASGGVKFSSSQNGYCPWWERTMISHGSPKEGTHEFPYLSLDDVNGPKGFASWVRLTLKHRRAVEPVVRHALFPNQTPESRLLSTAAAMEYWVASNARTAEWAQRRAGEALPGALSRHVDPAWTTWIGDADQWVDYFWETYLDLKHFRKTPPDPSTIHALEVSGRWLLTAALLDHCTESHATSRHLFSSGLRIMGEHVRDELWGGASP